MRQKLANSAVIASAIAAVLLAVDHNTTVFAPSAEMGAQERERCYGIAKAGMNDCGTAVHACAGRAVADGLPFEWKMVPAGTCEKVHGGRLKSSDETQS